MCALRISALSVHVENTSNISYRAINNEKLLFFSFRLVTVTSIYIFSRQDFNIIYFYIIFITFYIFVLLLLS